MKASILMLPFLAILLVVANYSAPTRNFLLLSAQQLTEAQVTQLIELAFEFIKMVGTVVAAVCGIGTLAITLILKKKQAENITAVKAELAENTEITKDTKAEAETSRKEVKEALVAAALKTKTEVSEALPEPPPGSDPEHPLYVARGQTPTEP